MENFQSAQNYDAQTSHNRLIYNIKKKRTRTHKHNKEECGMCESDDIK